MRAAEHAPSGPFNVLERRHGLAEIVEGGAGARVEYNLLDALAITLHRLAQLQNRGKSLAGREKCI